MKGAAIIGCGFIGQKRAQNLGGLPLLAVCDINFQAAAALAAKHPGCRAFSDWREAVALPDVSVVLAATTHDMLAPVSLGAVQAGKHVLVEKPGARSRAELEPVAVLAAAKKRVVKAGFNHRFHPAILKAREILDSGSAGPLMFIRARYGHGGRPGYDREWRAEPERSGGGELIDQGMHLIDLARMFLGEFTEVSGYTPTLFWDMPVEDNAFLLLKTAKGQAAWLHASWTEWKNLFSMEIYTRQHKLQIDGLGGSYGLERLTHYRMKPEMGPPDVEQFEFPGADGSWALEFEDFLAATRGLPSRGGDIQDCLAALAITDKVYSKGTA